MTGRGSLSAKSLSVLQREALLFASNLITSITIARELGPHSLGLWVILALIPSYSEMIGRVRIDAAAVYYMGKGKYQLGEVVSSLNLIAGVSSAVIISAIAIGYRPFVNALFGDSAIEVEMLVCVMLVQIPANFLYMNYMYLHVHREDIRSVNAMVLTRALGSSALVLVGLLGFGLGLPAVAIGSTLGVIFALVTGVWRLGKVERVGRLINQMLLRDLFLYGGRLYVGTAFSSLNTYASQAIVVAYCMPAQVAFFTIAQQLAQLLNKITEAIGTFLFPRISKEPELNVAAKLAAQAFRVSIVILLSVGLCAALLIYPAVLLLYGPSYAIVPTFFCIILPGVILAAAASCLTTFYQGIGRAGLVAKVAVVPLILQITLGLVLVPRLQTTGAAITLLVSLSSAAFFQVYVFSRVSKATVRGDLIVRRSDLRTVSDFLVDTIRRRLRLTARR